MGLWLLTRPLGFIFRPIGLLMRGDFRGLFALLLGFALLGGLWEAALFSLSTPATATVVMTEAGVAVINPALGAMGVGPAALASIQGDAATHPSDPVTIPGLKTDAIALTTGDLAGLTFDQATRTIYGNVAKAYYAGGPDAVFTVSMPTVSLVPDSRLDWLTALGLSASTMTARGHAQTQQLALYLWGAAGLLGLLVLVLSKGWTRLYAVSQAIFTGAVPGLALIGAVAFLWQRAPGDFTPFSALLHAIGGAVVPVYVGAGIAAVAALVVGALGSAAAKTATAARGVRRTPVPAAGRSAQPAAASYRGFDAPAQAPRIYSNMGGGSAGGVDSGATPGASPADGARPYGPRQAYGGGPAQAYRSAYGSAYGSAQGYAQALPTEGANPQGGQAQPYPLAYGQRPTAAAGQPGGSFEARSPQPTGADGLEDGMVDGMAAETTADAWPGAGAPYPQQPRAPRAYPDDRSYPFTPPLPDEPPYRG